MAGRLTDNMSPFIFFFFFGLHCYCFLSSFKTHIPPRSQAVDDLSLMKLFCILASI